MYQLQRDYCDAKAERKQDIVNDLIVKDVKRREEVNADLTKIREQMDEFMQNSRKRNEEFVEDCIIRHERIVWQTSYELQRLKEKEERRKENRRQKRLRKKERLAKAKGVNSLVAVENAADEE